MDEIGWEKDTEPLEEENGEDIVQRCNNRMYLTGMTWDKSKLSSETKSCRLVVFLRTSLGQWVCILPLYYIEVLWKLSLDSTIVELQIIESHYAHCALSQYHMSHNELAYYSKSDLKIEIKL